LAAIADARMRSIGSWTSPSRALLAPGLLCLALALSAADAHAVWPFRSRDYPDPSRDLGAASAELLARAVRLNTVNPPGDEAPLARMLVTVMEKEGLEAKFIPTPSGGSKTGRGAAWGRLRGTGKRPPIVLLSHLDVVPAEGDGWAVDPFSGLVAGGFVVGRGALDAKGVTIVHLLAMVDLARRGVKLDRDVILLATPDEETGGKDGAGFIAREHKELLSGAEYLLTEGGGILVGEAGDPNVWGIDVSEKAPCWTRLVARGAAGHASTAGPYGAVPRLVAALERVRRLDVEMEIRVAPEVAAMFAALAPIADPDDRAGYRDLGEALASDPEFRRRFLADPARAALVRDTISITVLSAGSRTNVVPDEARAELDVRLLPGDRCDAFVDRLRAVVGDPTISVDAMLSFETRNSPSDTELFRAIETVAAEVDPGAAVLPRVIAGFTDSHYFRDIGIVAYGFVPRWLPPSETRGIHGQNERVSIENLERGVHTTVRILEVLGGRP
jgi:acetylornithine deacetylase/succinyl-diaminopimelate desuccinylase-like protein